MSDAMLTTASSMTLAHAVHDDFARPATLFLGVEHARDRGVETAKRSLVSVPTALHFELYLAKTSEKTSVELLYRSIWSWFTSAAERRHIDQAVDVFGRIGTSYVDACRLPGKCTFGGG
jgi:hypothetical protein